MFRNIKQKIIAKLKQLPVPGFSGMSLYDLLRMYIAINIGKIFKILIADFLIASLKFIFLY
jgi:hypothetical protein